MARCTNERPYRDSRTILSFQFCYLVLVGKFKQTQRTLFFVGRLVGRFALDGLFAFAFFLCAPFGCLKRLNVVIFGVVVIFGF